MAAHRYWRINITDGFTSDYGCSIAEIEMANAPGGADLCTGGTAIASDYYSGWPPADAFDGAELAAWHTASLTSPVSWIGYDFGSGNDVEINVVRLKCRLGYPEHAPKIFDIQYSDDGSLWYTYWSESLSSGCVLRNGVFGRFFKEPTGVPETTAWLVHITATQTDYLAMIADVEFRSMAGVSEIHTTDVGPINEDAVVGWPATGAFDGDHDTAWASEAGLPTYMGYEFIGAKNVVEVALSVYGITGQEDNAPKDFTIQRSINGVDWDTEYTATGETGWSLGETRVYVITFATGILSPSGEYEPSSNIEIVANIAGATIYYTTDGSDPTTYSAVYSSPIPMFEGTLKAFAVLSGYSDTGIVSATYTLTENDDGNQPIFFIIT